MSANSSPCTIKLMSGQNLETAIDWAANEGWNPGLRDGECFHAADPGGFFMAWQNGRPIGSISAVKYSDHFSFIGLFMVIPECRGHRTGLELANAANIHLGNTPVGIDGVEAKVKNYHSQYGFDLAWHNIRMVGTVPTMLKSCDMLIRPAAMLSFSDVCAFDQRHFLAPREKFLKLWMTRLGTVSLAALDIHGNIEGMGVARPCRNGTKIGPLFADNSLIAENLLRELLRYLPPASNFFLDLPEPNNAAMTVAGKYAMKPVFKTARMYRGGRPDLPLENIFGITSFELG